MLPYALAHRLLLAGYSQGVNVALPVESENDAYCPSGEDLVNELGALFDRLDECGSRFCAFGRGTNLVFWGATCEEALAHLYLHLHP